MDKEMMRCLSADFEAKEIQTKPGRGNSGALRFVSHGSTTARLNECDPAWSSEILKVHEQERRDKNNQPGLHVVGITMRLTVGGISREEFGHSATFSTWEAEYKNAMSDALKRCAMRFGVALRMWEHLIDAQDDDDTPAERAEGAVAARNTQSGTSTHNAPQTQRGATQNQSQRDDPVEASLTSGEATQRQLRYMQAVAREAGYDAAGLDALSQKEFGVPIAVLSRSDATNLIDFIQNDSINQPPQPKVEANGQPVKVSSKQDPDDPNSVLPTKRREDMLKAIFNHTKGQITATDLNNLCVEQFQHSLQRITFAESRALYTQILNANTYELTAQRDDLRRQKQPITSTLMKKLWAVADRHTPEDIKATNDGVGNFLHVQLFEHLGLGSVKDMSTYDVDKMISVYEGQNFLDPAPVGGSGDVGLGDEPPY